MAKKKKDNDLNDVVQQILKTTDGFLGNRPDIKKPRNVVVVEQRKDDGAIAVAKISSKQGKEEKIGKNFIPDLVLDPKTHGSLTEDSIVSRQVIVGVKRIDKNGQEFRQSIFPNDMTETGDKLTDEELEKVRKEVHNDDPKHRKSFIEKLRKWFNHFKE